MFGNRGIYWYDEEGAPKRCHRCDSVDIDMKIMARDEAFIYEYEAICEKCGQPLGYFAYGSWDPAYRKSFEESCND